MARLIGLIGVVVIIGIAYLASVDRKAIQWRMLGWGISLQVIFGLLVLKIELGRQALSLVASGARLLISFTDYGSRFLFGALVDDSSGFIFAFRVLPIVIFISSFFSCLYYLGIMQRIVLAMAKIMKSTMKVSGAESLGAAANVMMGQTEAPIIVAPYIPTMTRSELLALMVGGMATVSGAILGGYIGLGISAEYLIAGSIMAAPASLMMAKILLPETEVAMTAGTVRLDDKPQDSNIIEAAARGASQGMTLALNIAAMLVAFIAIIYMLNGILSAIGNVLGLEALLGVPVTFELILGYLLSPLAFLMGVPWRDANAVGELVGLKLVLNELIAYTKLAQIQADLTPKAQLISTFALCGFANFSSVGIQIGGIGALAPERRTDLAQLGLRALLGGSLATFLTATIAGMLS